MMVSILYSLLLKSRQGFVKYSSMARNFFVLRVFAENIMTDDLIFSIDLLVDL